MTKNAALKLAVVALEEQARRLAVDANMLDLYGIRTRQSEAASKQRSKLIQACYVLRDGHTPDSWSRHRALQKQAQIRNSLGRERP